jgi:site-specific recombinase XerD
VTVRDVTDFRSHLHRDKRQAVASINRALITIPGFFDWLLGQRHVDGNPAKSVKELRRQPLAPKGLDRADVRRLLREIELRQDVRASAIFSLLLYTGCRVSDLVSLELTDVLMSDRYGSVVFRHGKGSKQRTVPLPLPARKAVQAYLDTRPSVASSNVFVG